MRRWSPVAAVALVASLGCDLFDSPADPTPIFAADLQGDGDLVVSRCFDQGSFLDCDYQGEIRNRGDGCADDVRGITRAFVDDEEFGRSDWAIVALVRPGEAVLYEGTGLAVPPGPEDWTYDTEVFWTDVACL